MLHTFNNALTSSGALSGVAGNSMMFSPPLTPSAHIILLLEKAPRSRRDKDMSDNKAIKQTIKVYKQNEILHTALRAV